MRVPLTKTAGWASTASPRLRRRAYQNAVVSFVNLLTANGLVAIVDLHGTAPGTSLSATLQQQVMADEDHSPPSGRAPPPRSRATRQ